MTKLEKGQSSENCLTQVNSNMASRLLTESSCLKNKVLADYNIHDYLPSETQIPDYNITIKTHQHIEKHLVSEKPDPISVPLTNQNNELVARIIETTQQMNKYKQQNQTLKKQIEQLREQQTQIINKNKDNENQLEKCKDIITTLGTQIQQASSDKENLELQIKTLTQEINKKKANIRIFCQKYEATFQPIIKHSYTVEVQTASADQYNNYADIMPPRNRRIASLPTGQQFIHENQSQKKPKSMFYEIYQQKIGNPNLDNLDLHNQPTTRSQVLMSGQKMRKPKFLQNDSNFKHEGNIRHRESKKQILDRIDGGKENKMGLSNLRNQQHRYKVREEQLEIYPIEEDNVEQIVQGLLASFK